MLNTLLRYLSSIHVSSLPKSEYKCRYTSYSTFAYRLRTAREERRISDDTDPIYKSHPECYQ